MAESKKKDPCRITLKNVRLSYPNVFTPRAFGRGEGKPAFSASALIPKDTKHGEALIIKIEDAIEAAKEKKWPGKQVKIKKANIAFSDGDDVEDDDDLKPEQEGMMVVRARNYKRPMVLDENNDELREQDNIIYGGCFVDMIVTFWGQDYEGSKRMNCSLEGIRYRSEGEAFGAGPINPDEFDEDDDGDRKPSRNSRRRRGRDDDDEPSRSSRRGRDDDDDEPSRSSRRGRDDDEDEKPSRSRRGRDDDEDDKPARGSRRARDDDEDEKPSRSRRGRDDDEDEKPARSSRRGRDDDDEDEDDRRSSRSSRRGRDDEDEDDRPSRSSRRGKRDDLA